MHADIEALTFGAGFADALPADPERANFRRQVHGACYSDVMPTPVRAPRLAAASAEVCALLGLSPEAASRPSFAEVLGGNRVLPGMRPHAACYGGHQFGHWAGQLGDGRAITLGDVAGAGGQRWELQLKGAGPTPYSRTADGRAVLRSSLREFICSEAMHHLGVPTTRALSLVLTGEPVVRDMFYDGHPRPEPGAVVCRVAPSFVRFGSFEIHASRDDTDTLRQLTEWVVRRHYPHLLGAGGLTAEVVVAMLEQVSRLTAEMIVGWMRVGFVHGVMNTDNMSILGLTIDYGPYGWLDVFDPDWTPNTTDASGRRYRFGQQPQVALWNLVKLAEALYPMVGEAAPLEGALGVYRATYERAQRQMMRDKLGLLAAEDGDDALVQQLMRLMSAEETDYTLFFRGLMGIAPETRDDGLVDQVTDALYGEPSNGHAGALLSWLRDYRARVAREAEASGREHEERRLEAMGRANPLYIPRNYLAQEAIDAAEAGDFGPLQTLLYVVRRPYELQAGREHHAGRRPEWARHRAGCSMLSCSS